jgi:RNA polymerase sigma-70 factor (ECF subfamily)
VSAARQSGAGVDPRDDTQLMAQIVSGSREAFEGLYSRHHRRAYKVALSVCRDHDRAEDAVQDAFAAIWRGGDKYEPRRGAVAPWLLSLVRYRAVDVARANSRHETRRALEASLETRVAAGDVIEAVVADDDAADLRARLARLPALQLEVITLAYFGELSHSEIATKLGLPTGTVKGRMRLGMHKLRADVDPAQHLHRTAGASPDQS